MAEPETAKAQDIDQHTDSAKSAGGDAALKAIAHLQQVAETLAADAAKLAEDKPEQDQSAQDKPAESKAADTKAEARKTDAIKLPALTAVQTEARAGKDAGPARDAADWRAGLRQKIQDAVWSQTAAAAVLMLVVAGGGYLGFVDYLDRKEQQRIAAEEALRHPPETLAEREMRGKIAELHLELQSLRSQITKIAGDTRAALTQAQSHKDGPDAKTIARLDRLEKDFGSKLDQQVARVERLERLAADPIVTSSIPRQQKGQPTSAAGAPAPVAQGLRTPDPSMKPNTFVLRSVRNGIAMVQTRGGMLEVGPGDLIPGVGRVRSIEKMDGRWVLVMHDGYIDQEED